MRINSEVIDGAAFSYTTVTNGELFTMWMRYLPFVEVL